MSFEVKPIHESTCPDFEDLSPDSRMEYQAQLDLEIAALEQKRAVVTRIQQANPIERTLLVVGLNDHRVPDTVDFAESFKAYRAQQGRFEGQGFPKISSVDVLHERNYKFVNGAWLKSEECYIRLRSVKEARFLEDIVNFPLCINLGHNGKVTFYVRFMRPAQDDETRKTFNVIGKLVERLHAVRKELYTIEFTRPTHDDAPTLSSKYVDFSEMKQNLMEMREARLAGRPVNYSMLVCQLPVDKKKLEARLHELCREEIDLLMGLRDLQSDGFVFDF